MFISFLFKEVNSKYLELNRDDDDICLVDSDIMHSTLKNKMYFSYLKMGKTNVIQ